MHDLILKDECYSVIGACMAVHCELGAGFLEPVYQEALAIEFDRSRIPFEQEKMINILYKGQLLNKAYIADFLCYGQIIIELKALNDLSGDHLSQILNYLKATNHRVGLLINFGKSSLQYKRVVL
ncbi:MAG: GxxExxY protein [Candidatus Cloacimonadaceae bacterium]|nr:GxxExxY protein [Candidatus Cloacimonadaceae bacterium]